ncbi:MAG: metallophosphoesterase [Methanothrix sp.]|nr:metallophosphoesterase [Methanothrix sp.]MDD4447751.1 metallophosphoesterase [Methanothrix sp.]
MSRTRASTGSVIVVSDLHLAEKNDQKCTKDESNFVNFIEYIASNQLNNGGDLILLGDTFDFWRRSEDNIKKQCSPIINALKNLRVENDVRIHCVVGNHDYNLIWNNPFPIFDTMDEYLLLKNKREFFFIHGYHFDIYKYNIRQMNDLSQENDNKCDRYKTLLGFFKILYRGLYMLPESGGQAMGNIWDSYEFLKEETNTLKLYDKHDIEMLMRLMNIFDKNSIEMLIKQLNNAPDKRNANFSEFESIIRNESKCIWQNINGCKTDMIDNDHVVIFGHIHISEQNGNIASVGSWNKMPNKSYSYMEINGDGRFSLAKWDPKKDTYLEEHKWERYNVEDDEDDD